MCLADPSGDHRTLTTRLYTPHNSTQRRRTPWSNSKLRLATTTEDSIKSIKDQLWQFSDKITLFSHNTETDEIVFDFDVPNDEVYQALGDQCRSWIDEPKPSITTYALIRGQ
ncbi:hypothetical protein Q7P35_003920 [Cladosporium inversicolor]